MASRCGIWVITFLQGGIRPSSVSQCVAQHQTQPEKCLQLERWLRQEEPLLSKHEDLAPGKELGLAGLMLVSPVLRRLETGGFLGFVGS